MEGIYIAVLWHCSSGAIMVLVCHMIYQDQLTKESSNILRGDPQGYPPSYQFW